MILDIISPKTVNNARKPMQKKRSYVTATEPTVIAKKPQRGRCLSAARNNINSKGQVYSHNIQNLTKGF